MSFEVISCLKKKVKVTRRYWKYIVTKKHTVMKRKENLVKNTLEAPDEVRKSTRDPTVHLYYKKINQYLICVVAKHLDDEGFIVTAYLTDRIKAGELVWRKF